MKKVLFVVAALCATFANGAPAPIAVGPEAFDPHGAHIQGIAASEDAPSPGVRLAAADDRLALARTYARRGC